MTPQRIAVKFFTSPDPSATPDLTPFTGLFHEFIQKASVEGLLIDVADYAHVPNGPGILLIGHDVDYGLDQVGGLAGLLTVRKQFGVAEFADVLDDTLRMALGCVAAIENDGRTGLHFDTGIVEIQLIDRLAAPNTDAAFESACEAAAPVLAKLFGSEAKIERSGGDDSRNMLALRASAAGGDASALLARLDSRPMVIAPVSAASSPKQSDWDISVEDLKAMMDAGEDFFLLDVREDVEIAAANIGGTQIRLAEVAARADEVPRDKKVAVLCKVGLRGAKATTTLRQLGFDNAWNVEGGLQAWSERIDSDVPTY
jgi:rhodanese-related sulfurtransferase